MSAARALPFLLVVAGLSASCHQKPARHTQAAVAATGFAYTDPTETGWRLLRNPASTSTRLVLDLVGPSGLQSRGVGFNLQGPPGVTFDAFDDGLPLKDLGVYQLHRSGAPVPSEPVALMGGVKPGNLLSVGIFQKDRAQGARDSGVALCQIALLFDASAKLVAGSPIPLSVVKARMIPEDIGATTDPLWLLAQKMQMPDIAIALGTLTAR